MKNTVLFALTLLILASCALKKADHSAPTAQAPVETKKSTPVSKTGAIFHVIEPLGVKLILTKVESKKEEIVLMDKTLSQLTLKPGFWKVSGFILNETRYKIMNTSKQFIFRIKKNKMTYVGSYIFQCPKVNQIHVEEMKKMSFFNRYPYSSKKSLCELVVGSDFDNVNRVWLELDKSQHLPLSLGF
jgi:hypothetical protein